MVGATAPLRCELFVNYFTVYLTGRRSFCQLGSVFAILDNVNDLAGVLRWYDGKLELLLIDQSEQFGDTSAPYLTDARLWVIEDESLQAFMQQFYEYPSVVYDTTGGE